jgi:hypothetical protein
MIEKKLKLGYKSKLERSQIITQNEQPGGGGLSPTKSPYFLKPTQGYKGYTSTDINEFN